MRTTKKRECKHKNIFKLKQNEFMAWMWPIVYMKQYNESIVCIECNKQWRN